MSLSIPRIYSERYEIEHPLGEGAFSRTYLARDNVLQRKVAVKVLRREHAANDEFTARFDREAQAAALVSHPNVVAVYDFGKEQGLPYIIMQYVDGMTLRQYVRDEGPLTIEEITSFTRQVLDGLAAIHDQGIVHRDVKPQNVLLDQRLVAKLSDFGVAFLQHDTTLTQDGTTIGTAAYMAPEQATGQRVGPQADLYAVGVMLYEMLTGRLPFRGDNPVQVLYRHVSEQPVRPRNLNPTIPLELEAVVLRALAKMPADRFSDARAMRDALSRPVNPVVTPPSTRVRADPEQFRPPAQSASVAAQPTRPSAVAVPPRERKRRKSRAGVIPLIVLALLLAGTGAVLALREINSGDGNVLVGADSTPTGTEEPGGIPAAAETAAEAATPTEASDAAIATEPVAEPTPTGEPLPSPTPEPPPTETPQPEPTATATLTPEPEPTPEPDPTAEPVPPENDGPPLLVSAVPPEWEQGQSQSFGRDEFVAGGAYQREDGVLYDRPAAHLYAQATDFPATTVTFNVDERPTNHVGLVVIGMDDERPGAVPCRISLNDKVIWEGPSPFGNERWTQVIWQINALGWIRNGENSLRIEMLLEEGQFGLPPWILLTEATVYWD